MNMSGVIKGGLVAGLLINVSEYVLNMMVIPVPEGAGGSIGFWVVYAFVMGLLTAYLYALIRPRCGAGPKTGVCAGLLVWALHTLLPAGGMWNMGMAPDGCRSCWPGPPSSWPSPASSRACCTASKGRSAGLRPASRGSAKPALIALLPVKVGRTSSPLRGAGSRSGWAPIKGSGRGVRFAACGRDAGRRPALRGAFHARRGCGRPTDSHTRCPARAHPFNKLQSTPPSGTIMDTLRIQRIRNGGAAR